MLQGSIRSYRERRSVWAIMSPLGLHLLGHGRILRRPMPYAPSICRFGFITNRRLIEMEIVTLFPLDGSFIRLAGRMVDPALGVAVGWNHFVGRPYTCEGYLLTSPSLLKHPMSYSKPRSSTPSSNIGDMTSRLPSSSPVRS